MNTSELAFADINLRTEMPADEAFLRLLYASTRADEMAYVPWTDDQKAAFLNMQFDLQRQSYLAHYAQGQFQIILINSQPAGRFYLDRNGEAYVLIDIALLPHYCGQGVGGQLLATMLSEAAAESKAVRLHVETTNRALKLYLRLGFIRIEDQGIRWLMERKPD